MDIKDIVSKSIDDVNKEMEQIIKSMETPECIPNDIVTKVELLTLQTYMYKYTNILILKSLEEYHRSLMMELQKD